MARKSASVQWAERLADCRRRCDEEEWRQRVTVITEFGAEDTPATHAMAAEILRYRYCIGQFADAIELIRGGAQFGLLRPGPYWRPRRSVDDDVVPPAA